MTLQTNLKDWLMREMEAHRNLFVVLAIIPMIIYLVYDFDNGSGLGPRDKRPTLEKIYLEYNKIPPPATARRLGKRDTDVSRYGSISVGREFEASGLTSSILAYYKELLTRNGWTYHHQPQDVLTWGDNYCKGNIEASITIKSDTNGVDPAYEIFMRWGSDTELYCL